MTRTSNNTRSNTRHNNATDVNVEVTTNARTDKRIEPVRKTATQLAAEKAAKQAERDAKREAAKAAREREQECGRNYAAATMTLNDVFRAVNAHKDERIHEDGTTVESFLAEYGLTKLNLKSLKAVLPAAFVDADGSVCMPTAKCATCESAAEDKFNGKPVYYFVVKGKGKDAKRTYKKAQVYGFSRIDLWTPAVLLRLLKAAHEYPTKHEHYAKRNAEVKAAKQFYVVNDIIDTAMSTKVADKSTRTTTYTRIDTANVKWAE